MNGINKFLFESTAIALGIASTAALLNNHAFDILIFIISFITLAIALYDDDSMPVVILKFIVATGLVFFYPIPGLFYLVAISLPFFTKDPLILSLKGLLFPLFALTLRGGEFLFTRESISYAFALFGAYIILLKPDDKRAAFSGLIVSILASATLKSFIFLFPAQLILLFTLFQAPTQVIQVTALVYLIITSFSGFCLY
ncbi:MAG: hypothetical protein ACK4HV_07550, partial [Parachlamydiaceae bacterium]